MRKFLKIIIIILVLIPLFFVSILLFSDGKIKYTEQIEIEAPIELVDELFQDIYNMKKYMPETKDIILMNGVDNKAGAEYKIIISMGSDSMVMKGTLIQNNLPDSLTMWYEMEGVLNIMKQRHKIDKINTTTLIINEQEFQFEKGIMKIVTFLKPNIFKEQTKIYLQSFKKFVEEEWAKLQNN